MFLISDVHGANDALREVGARGEPLLILGDLINFIDYRTMDGIFADICGRELVAELVGLRTMGRFEEAQERWRQFSAGREDELRTRLDARIEEAYRGVRAALEGAEAYVIYGNVDRPDILRRSLPDGCRFVDAEVVEIEGWKVGFVGGGVAFLGVPGELTEDQLAEKLGVLGEVDILCTHVAPAVPQLSRDIIGGRRKESRAVLGYLLEARPRWHYFGDIHQPQAVSWRVGDTLCLNLGYFRATRRAVRHG
ncbi:MAG: metallophosphoesterase [Acidimicrobiia bacterium]